MRPWQAPSEVHRSDLEEGRVGESGEGRAEQDDDELMDPGNEGNQDASDEEWDKGSDDEEDLDDDDDSGENQEEDDVSDDDDNEGNLSRDREGNGVQDGSSRNNSSPSFRGNGVPSPNNSRSGESSSEIGATPMRRRRERRMEEQGRNDANAPQFNNEQGKLVFIMHSPYPSWFPYTSLEFWAWTAKSLMKLNLKVDALQEDVDFIIGVLDDEGTPRERGTFEKQQLTVPSDMLPLNSDDMRKELVAWGKISDKHFKILVRLIV
jgi:hypothetical protein